MPTYEYKCNKDDCGYQFELKQGFDDKPKKKCPICKRNSLEKLLFAPHVFVKLGDSELKTVGHLAHRNTENMGKYELESKEEKDPNQQRKKRLKEKAPWWRPGTTGPSKKLMKMTEKEKKEYVHGKK